jgi:hypothetical protein
MARLSNREFCGSGCSKDAIGDTDPNSIKPTRRSQCFVDLRGHEPR